MAEAELSVGRLGKPGVERPPQRSFRAVGTRAAAATRALKTLRVDRGGDA